VLTIRKNKPTSSLLEAQRAKIGIKLKLDTSMSREDSISDILEIKVPEEKP